MTPSTPDSTLPDGLSLWQFVSARGMSRRRFLQLMGAGGSAAVSPRASEPKRPAATPSPTATPTMPEVGARPAPTSRTPRHSSSATARGWKTRLENIQGLITPNRYFFVRNNSVSIGLDAADWRLSVEGDAVSEPLELTYEDIRSLPSRTLISYLECAGNHRAMFNLLNSRETSGTQWTRGAISNGEWLGATLRDVLTLAGIDDGAVSAMLVGLDTESPEEGFRYVLPMEKAMHPDTLLAYALNGETIPKDHGYPLRAVVPGWVGSSHIKWLGRIVVSSEQLWTRNNTTSYTLIGDEYAPEGESMGKPVTEQVIKSALALPWPAELAAGQQRIHGYAHSPAGPISLVEWSADSGLTWRTPQSCRAASRTTHGRGSSSCGTRRRESTRSRLGPRTRPATRSPITSPTTRRATCSTNLCPTLYEWRSPQAVLVRNRTMPVELDQIVGR